MEDKRTIKDRWIDFKASIGRKKDQLYVWAGENKELIVICAPIIVGGVFEIIKLAVKRDNVNREEELKNDYIYDHRLGHYYQIKHIRSDRKRNNTYLEIDRRRRNGEYLGDILDDMCLLR